MLCVHLCISVGLSEVVSEMVGHPHMFKLICARLYAQTYLCPQHKADPASGPSEIEAHMA